MNQPYIIVGGGLSGLLIARSLQSLGISFLGFEKDDRLGGNIIVGHHRVYERDSADILTSFSGSTDWSTIDDKPQTLNKKGEWVNAAPLEETDENFYMQVPFLEPTSGFGFMVRELIGDIGQFFRLKTSVTKVDPLNKTVLLQNGELLCYERLFWCCDLHSLPKNLVGDKTPLLKLLKNSPPTRKGINVDLELKLATFRSKNILVLPFRFKDKKLRALGIAGTHSPNLATGQILHWRLFLDADFADDHEEVAKCLRAFRKALEKEFPEIKENLITEKIFFLSSAGGEQPAQCKNPEIFPDLFYLGSQLDFTHAERSFRDLDMVLQNLKSLRETCLTNT
jgi:hypothetical protein